MTSSVPRIWLDPPRFWAATEHLTERDKADLFEQVWRLAERRDYQGLRRFDFVRLTGEALPEHREQ